MAVIQYRGFDVTVADIAARNAISNKVDHMVVIVTDAIADPEAGSGKATYRYDASDSSWILVSSESSATMSFLTEELTISEGQVEAQNIIADGTIWNLSIVDGDVIIAQPREEDLTIVNGVISGLSAYNGYKIRFTYAYASIAAQITGSVEELGETITAEATARANADVELQSNLDSDVAALTTLLNAEATARANADSDHSAAIAAEIAATNADVTSLQGQITNNDSDIAANALAISNEVSARSSAVSSEATARANADSDLQANIDLKANISSPSFTGTPTVPTATAGTDTNQVATTAFVSTAIDNLVGGAPGALDTLNELSAAIGDDSDYAATITSSLGTKADKSNVLELDNTTVFTPDTDYEPATKKYVDDNKGISPTDYATSTTGGTVKMRIDGTTLYITNDGTDA